MGRVRKGRSDIGRYVIEQVGGIEAISLPGPLLVVLSPPPDLTLTLQLHSEGLPSWLRIEAGEMSGGRGDLSRNLYFKPNGGFRRYGRAGLVATLSLGSMALFALFG